ncbi:restriction endonuclease subunit S [Brevundimonas halotolerans]|uniref:Type I restriction enzyme S subunit n=1 Tax=Brevundimonas halotolerans TaxID=69670 RepID=A0A7W9A449_9CAUL|nr:restriction endonuclease subunit S [Brevundimonas halotolerans]MBB5661122.1 type I restriction enzyme S subunit [Brevundimonas halotolerans]
MPSEVPEGWKQTTLGAVADITRGVSWRDENETNKTTAGALPVLGIRNVQQSLKLDDTVWLTGLSQRSVASSTVRRGDILMVGSNGNPARIGNSVRIDVAGVYLYASLLFGVRPDEAQADGEFLFHLIRSTAVQKAISDTVQGSTGLANLKITVLRDTRLLLPPLEEQRRIAEVLRSASATCEASNRVVEKYGAVIQTEIDSVVAELVNDPSIPKVHLGEVAMVKGGKRLPKGSQYSDDPTGFRYVRVTDWNDHEIEPARVQWIPSETAAAIRRYTISSADLFISIAGSIGLVALVPAELDGAHLTENAAKIVLRDDQVIDRNYLLLALMSGSLTDQIRQQKGVGGGVPKLALFRIEALEIPLPSIDRQREIAASYRSLKAARSISSQASKAAVRVFETLAADLLSGRVRVPA